MESATVERRVPGYAGLLRRAGELPTGMLATAALIALVVVAFAGFFLWVTYPNYDSYYSLLWGREILDLDQPSFDAYRAPTEHPLAVAFGVLLAPFGSADRLFVLATLLSLVALVAGTYRLGRICFTPFVGAIAAALVLTRFDFASLAVRGYIDIPFLALIVWAGALEAARPRRGTSVFLLLAAAGLMRPDGWLVAGAYFLWMSWRASWAERAKYAALAAIGPVVWATTDLVVTGNPLFSFTSTADLAAELQRTESGTAVLSKLPGFLRETAKTPVFFAGLAGLAIALWRFPLRLAIPATLFLAGVLTFLATGLAGLSVIVRYLMVPTVMLCVFAAVTLGGFTMVRRGTRLRKAWATGALAATLLGLAYTGLNPPSLTRINNELNFRGDAGRSLRAILSEPAVKDGLRNCGPLSVPTHKLIPDARWILDRGAGGVVARSDPSPSARSKSRFGVALFPVGRTNVLRTGFAVSTDTLTLVPHRRFRRIAFDRYFAAYLRCPGDA